MKKTLEQIRTFYGASTAYLSERPENKDTKIGYAIKKTLKKVSAPLEDYDEKIIDNDIDHCHTNSEGVMETNDDGSYKFKPADLKNKRKAAKKIWKEEKDKEYEFETYYATQVPAKLDSGLREAFEGFVIEPVKVESNGQAPQLEKI